MTPLFNLAIQHLLLRLRPLNRALARAVENQKAAAAQMARPELSPLCLTDEHVRVLLQQVGSSQSGTPTPNAPALLELEERRAEEQLRAQAKQLNLVLPLDRLSRDLQLTSFEQETLLLCAAPELDRAYERIYAFILDDLNRRFPCLELLVSLTASSLEDQLTRRHVLSSFGRLRRFGMLSAFGQPPTDLRQEFRLGPEVFTYLTGAGPGLARLYRDHNEVFVPDCMEPPPQIDQDQFTHLADALKTGAIAIIAIWGACQNALAEVVLALASAAGWPLRQLSPADLEQPGCDPALLLREHLRIAAGREALLWFDTDRLSDPSRDRMQQFLVNEFANCSVPIILTGLQPWRQEPLLRRDGYAELELGEPKFQQRERMWSHSFPELEPQEIEDLASRFSLSGIEINSVSKLARTRARLAGNGRPEPVQNHLGAACSVVTQRTSTHFTTIVSPRHRPEDLVLRADLHRQVVEVATFFRLRRRVDEEWGFSRLGGGSGLKALFTGDPGTGKTLAAEVIAGLLGVSLQKVDLARIVSKWVGETEKNLESAFREAEQNQSVLFFDEAEALFGKRAEVEHGTDRYANLEISYLLQRLEDSRALVILASNVKDQIDSAFVRRFHVTIHFPRPGLEERRRIWTMAFPKAAPVSPDVELEALARLDMTGAAIVTTARSAALMAADAGFSAISMANVVRAAARQFRREARILTPSDLGSYGALLKEG